MVHDPMIDFVNDVKKIAQKMREEGSMPGMPVYILTMADELEQTAKTYEAITNWRAVYEGRHCKF